MGRTIRARWREGRLEPLERIELPDGKEVTVTIAEVSPSRNLKAFRGAAGGWKGTLNAPALIRRIYANRLISTRPRPPARKEPLCSALDFGIHGLNQRLEV